MLQGTSKLVSTLDRIQNQSSQDQAYGRGQKARQDFIEDTLLITGG